jgi:hypothetical protein
MSESLYQLVFRGRLAEGRDAGEVKPKVGALLKTDGDGLERLFSGAAVILKRGIDYQTALSYQRAFDATGARCDIEALDTPAARTSPAASAPAPPEPGPPPLPASVSEGQQPVGAEAGMAPAAELGPNAEGREPDQTLTLVLTDPKKLFGLRPAGAARGVGRQPAETNASPDPGLAETVILRHPAGIGGHLQEPGKDHGSPPPEHPVPAPAGSLPWAGDAPEVAAGGSGADNRETPARGLPQAGRAGHSRPAGVDVPGVVLLATPLFTSVLAWLSVGRGYLASVAASDLMLLVGVNLAATALFVAIEAGWLHMGAPGDLSKRAKRRAGPATWFLLVLIAWPLAYPAYLRRRSRYGAADLSIEGVMVMLVLVGTVVALSLAGGVW